MTIAHTASVVTYRFILDAEEVAGQDYEKRMWIQPTEATVTVTPPEFGTVWRLRANWFIRLDVRGRRIGPGGLVDNRSNILHAIDRASSPALYVRTLLAAAEVALGEHRLPMLERAEELARTYKLKDADLVV